MTGIVSSDITIIVEEFAVISIETSGEFKNKSNMFFIKTLSKPWTGQTFIIILETILFFLPYAQKVLLSRVKFS